MRAIPKNKLRFNIGDKVRLVSRAEHPRLRERIGEVAIVQAAAIGWFTVAFVAGDDKLVSVPWDNWEHYDYAPTMQTTTQTK
jgi:hypothetical protein